MRKLLKNNIVQKVIFKKTELTTLLLKVILKYLNTFDLDFSISIIQEIRKNSSSLFQSTLRQYCVISGRSRGLVTKFKVSRIVFREFSSDGLFVGIHKSGW